MSVEIKTTTVETLRNTFSHTRRRFGDKPATRYQEASFDIEAATNFHYRPLSAVQAGELIASEARRPHAGRLTGATSGERIVAVARVGT